MKAIIHSQYGPPNLLQLKNVDKPVPKKGELLVKVHAATVNRTDCSMLRAKPFIMRFVVGLFGPVKPSLGTDFAGEVEAVGEGVQAFKVGDRVFGFDDMGVCSHAQYMTIAEDKPMAIIPANTNYEQAAASLEGAHYAYNFIRKSTVIEGQSVLVNGATGAIGSAAVQILKFYKTKITAVCNTKNIELIQSMGVDKIIDYTKEDFTKDNQTYHFVFDTVGKSTFGQCKPILKAGGVYISSELGPNMQNVFFALYTPTFGEKKVVFPIPTKTQDSIDFIKKRMEEGAFKAVIDRRYPMEKIAEAFTYVETGEKTGNVIITMDH